ncbi:expressed unknown protein [Seminavis robusta]|uniref:Uncharacterized protein n=1 Tax=Seminavis robusta TaxID=568900 RepID=A0A9N8F3Y8_9STRA|nr:expressed unknown protein [Seminavis robusta]|eukprot:Sro2826_g338023.1  (1065) ;mRNA; r:6086-9280
MTEEERKEEGTAPSRKESHQEHGGNQRTTTTPTGESQPRRCLDFLPRKGHMEKSESLAPKAVQYPAEETRTAILNSSTVQGNVSNEKSSPAATSSRATTSATRSRHRDNYNPQQAKGTSQQQEDIMNIVADQASVAVSDLPLKGKTSHTQQDEHNLLQMATEINEAAKLEKFSHNRSADSGRALMQMATEINEAAKLEKFSHNKSADSDHSLMQMATEINEAAKLEKFSHNKSADNGHSLMQMATEINEAAKLEKISSSSSRPTESGVNSPDTRAGQLVSGTCQGTPHLPCPGAYMGTPGEALQRTNNLRFSLLGAPAPNTDDNEELQIAQGQTDSMPQVSPNNSNDARDGRELAVANLVVEDSEDFELQMRPPASLVDLQTVEENQRNRKRQSQLFVLFLAMLCIVAAIIVGTVAGTRKGKNPVTTSSIRTATPTAFGSLEPSGDPSSAPTGVLDFILEDLPNYTLESLQTFGTPQWRARDWLLDHQNITQLPEWRKTQLFALACFYYSFEGENWIEPIRERWMDPRKDECLWFSSGFSHFINGVYAEYSSSIATPSCNHLGEYTSLWVEDLHLSGLTPVVPSELNLLTSLSRLGLGWNKISASIHALLPNEVYEMTALTWLNLKSNQLSGGMPTEVGLLTALERLNLELNHLSGQIPSELGLLTALTSLVLYNNDLAAQIPSELGQLLGLNQIRLQWNQITGQVPTELGLLTALTWLWLATNELTGQVAPELALLTTLDVLWLDTNLLTGQIATEFGTVANLTVFAAATNLITGPIPSELALVPLKEFRLDANEMSGQVPAEIWSLTSLEYLQLPSNLLTGSLPTEIGLLSSLVELDLSGNRFTGAIPNEVGSMASLQKLYLDNNSLTGTLPQHLNESVGLRLDGNQFSGTVPEHLCSALWCDCTANVTQVSTCADLYESATFPGRFPPMIADGGGENIVLNIESDQFPLETDWVWQQESNVTGEWETLQESAGAIQTPFFLYSFMLSIAPDATYRLLVSDSYGDGLFGSGWVTLTASNQTVLYSFTDTPFTEISVVLLIGIDGFPEKITPSVYCDPLYDFC